MDLLVRSPVVLGIARWCRYLGYRLALVAVLKGNILKCCRPIHLWFLKNVIFPIIIISMTVIIFMFSVKMGFGVRCLAIRLIITSHLSFNLQLRCGDNLWVVVEVGRRRRLLLILGRLVIQLFSGLPSSLILNILGRLLPIFDVCLIGMKVRILINSMLIPGMRRFNSHATATAVIPGWHVHSLLG